MFIFCLLKSKIVGNCLCQNVGSEFLGDYLQYGTAIKGGNIPPVVIVIMAMDNSK
jgi:hypothetical protein